MNELQNIQSLYFVGAGGIGMSALIRYFLSKEKKVGGYDRVKSTLTDLLNQEGAEIHYEDNVALIPEIYKNPETTLVVFTPAIPVDHSELNYFRNNGFEVLKRAQVLGQITRSNRGICVAGTHGKTSTSGMISHLLKQSHVDCNAFLGGILNNYQTNLLLSDKTDLTVIEADEYDRSFHALTPHIAIITSVAPDHLDIYGDEENYRTAFEHFTSLIKNDGVLLMERKVDIRPELKPDVRLFTYSGEVENLHKKSRPDFYAQNIRIGNGAIVFDFVTPDQRIIPDIELGIPIEINITNGIAALAVAYLNGLSDQEMREGMKTFQGIRRRFDFHVKTENLVIIDDYAHHPEELEASISSVKKLYPDKKLTVVFQPHLYSRTRDFYLGFAEALSLADEVILLPIYPARENPIPGVDSAMILNEIHTKEKYLRTKEELLEQINEKSIEVLLIAGAGDIELLVEPIKKKLNA